MNLAVGSDCTGCPLSPYSSLTLTDSIQLVDDILSDDKIERMDKIERLEAILSAATASSSSSGPSSSSSASLTRHFSSADFQHSSSSLCSCNCHSIANKFNAPGVRSTATTSEASCQTLSTGDIVITKVYFPPNDGDSSYSDICLTPSPKKRPHN